MLNVVIPMAGAGSRFGNKGYKDPKPLIAIHGVPMIRVVINNLRPRCAHRFIFVCQTAHIDAYGLSEKLSTWAGGCVVVGLDAVTAGAACTVLAAKKYIDNDDPLMIANSDQYINTDINDCLSRVCESELDGLIMTMTASDPKWSFVELDGKKFVKRVVEKEVISDEATVGIYHFNHGRDFVFAAETMIAKNLRVNNEFYVAPAYNELIQIGKRIGIFNVGKESEGMYGLGTPNDLETFKNLPVSKKAVALR